MDNQPVMIIRCGPIFFFTTAFPPGVVSSLRTDTVDTKTSVIACGHPDLVDYFALVVSFVDAPHGEDPATYAKRQADSIREGVDYTWQQLYRRECVDSPDMPEWIDGDPRIMLLGLTDLSPYQATIVQNGREAVNHM